VLILRIAFRRLAEGADRIWWRPGGPELVARWTPRGENLVAGVGLCYAGGLRPAGGRGMVGGAGVHPIGGGGTLVGTVSQAFFGPGRSGRSLAIRAVSQLGRARKKRKDETFSGRGGCEAGESSERVHGRMKSSKMGCGPAWFSKGRELAKIPGGDAMSAEEQLEFGFWAERAPNGRVDGGLTSGGRFRRKTGSCRCVGTGANEAARPLGPTDDKRPI